MCSGGELRKGNQAVSRDLYAEDQKRTEVPLSPQPNLLKLSNPHSYCFKQNLKLTRAEYLK